MYLTNTESEVIFELALYYDIVGELNMTPRILR